MLLCLGARRCIVLSAVVVVVVVWWAGRRSEDLVNVRSATTAASQRVPVPVRAVRGGVTLSEGRSREEAAAAAAGRRRWDSATLKRRWAMGELGSGEKVKERVRGGILGKHDTRCGTKRAGRAGNFPTMRGTRGTEASAKEGGRVGCRKPVRYTEVRAIHRLSPPTGFRLRAEPALVYIPLLRPGFVPGTWLTGVGWQGCRGCVSKPA